MEQLVNKSFQIKLDADHPILKDHKVDSLSVLPGVVYLDYIYRVFEANNIDIKKYGIKNITFKNPLKLLSGEKERSLNMYIVKENDSILIIIKSIGADNKEPLLHFEGEVEPYEKDSVKDFPIEREIAAANVTVDMRDIYKKATEFKIQHGPFMTASGKLYKTDKNCIAHLRLPENFAGENRFIAHPCLLDASTLIGLVTFDIQYLTKPLLPIYIERFRIKSRIPEEIYVIARRLNGTKYENQDIVTNDIAIYNKYGHHIASFEKLKGKTIRDSAAFSIDKEKLKRSANGNGVPINISEKLNLEQSIENDLIHLIHQHYNIPLQELALDVGFYELGLDSNALMVLGESIEERIGKKIYPTLLFEYPTIQLLANYLKEKYGSSYKFSKTNQQERLEVENDVFIHKRVEERRIEQSKESVENCFAIVGLQGRFPQAEGIEKFWENISLGKNCIQEIPSERWRHECYYSDKKNDPFKTNSKWGGFVKDIDLFDPLFFRISGKEAERLDPQERCFLEMAYATMDDAGYTGKKYLDLKEEHKNKIGVFVGVMWNTYGYNGIEKSRQGNYEVTSPFNFSIANRVSHHFDFKGPSYVIDSACSSSLLAIYQACEEIKNGTCKWAIAGGVSLATHPSKYVFLSQFGMISSGNKNYSFSEFADGYLPGEGIGCVLIKPYADALKHDDHIYGVIRGGAVNHGGRSGGYSVPNPHAQEEVIRQGLINSNVLPEEIDYIEAHGTGTPLGDPIEINALSRIFRDRNLPLLVGSVKSNIGHLESASGIAGLSKVLMQFKYEQIAPSIHSEQLNSKIDFVGNKIQVVQQLTDWKSKKNVKPRIAGISSFGAGGTNVHIVVEEPPVRQQQTLSSISQQLFVISAKNDKTLKVYIASILRYIEQKKKQLNFQDIVHTMLYGRQVMNCRLVIIAKDIEELIGKMKHYLDEGTSEDFFISKNSILSGSENIYTSAAKQWINSGKITEDTKYHISGCMISLPAYPFDRKRYWLENDALTTTSSFPVAQEILSGTDKWIFDFKFSGDEDFIKDHQFDGNKVFPGAAYVTIANSVARKVAETTQTISGLKLLRSLMFKDQPETLRVIIKKEEAHTGFMIVHPDDEKLIYCKGTYQKNTALVAAASNADSSVKTMEKEEVYQLFKQRGLRYGDSFQLINRLEGNENRSYSKVTLSDDALQNWEHLLIPQLLDVALQTTIGVGFENNPGGVPIGFDKITILGKPTKENNVFVVKKQGSSKRNEYDISMTNEKNEVIIQIVGYESIVLMPLADKTKKDRQNDLIYFKQQWKQMEKSVGSITGITLLFNISSLDLKSIKITENTISNQNMFKMVHRQNDFKIVVGGDYEMDVHQEGHYDKLFDSLAKEQIQVNQVVIVGRAGKNQFTISELLDETNPKELYSNTTFLLKLCQAIQRKKVRACKHIVWVGATNETFDHPLEQALIGMLRSLEIEMPSIKFKSLWIDELKDASHLHENLIQILASQEKHIKIAGNNFHSLRVGECQPESVNNITVVKKGVYIITGGAGGIGKAFAMYLAEKYNANIVLVGRKKQDDRIGQLLLDIRLLGGTAIYHSCDITDLNACEKLIEQVEKKHTRINGIVHSAGVINDALLAKKTSEDMKYVLDPKVMGFLNIDQSTKNKKMDWLVACSSISSILGNIGQGDYAAGNHFMDIFCDIRNKGVAMGIREGRTVSINWPYWKDGGMRISEQQEERLFRTIGMEAISNEDGMSAFIQMLKSDQSNMIIFKGDKEKYTHNVIHKFQPTEIKAPLITSGQTIKAGNAKRKELVGKLVQTLAKLLKVEEENIDLDTALEEYGLDSILMIQIFDEMEQELGFTISPSSLMENPTINLFADHLMENYGSVDSMDKEGIAPNVAIGNKESFVEIESPATSSVLDKQYSPNEAYAIIGLAGRFPGAPNISTFWDKLCNAETMIDEISQDRINLASVLNATSPQIGKTYSKWAGLIDGVDCFDNEYFHISNEDALMMDPQQRVLLELTQHLFDHSGYKKEELDTRSVGVFIGAGANNYYNNIEEYITDELARKLVVNKIPSMISARISSYYNLSGPALTIDTACSSSLVAIDQACKGIKEKECRMAIAGGIFLPVDEHLLISFSNSKVLSKDGKCKVFDKKADGIVLGEGAGLVLIKSLNEALKDGDQIFGIIKGSSVNNDGKTMGITAPNMQAQENVIRTAIRHAGIDPSTIGYLEAHGTGTLLGDPIEIKAASKVYSEYSSQPGFCKVGSVKSNIGHLLTAAGVSGVIKVLLSLHHKMIPPTLNCNEPHPRFNFGSSPFSIAQRLEKWELSAHPRRAAISSFGFSGTNCHMIIEEMPEGHIPTRVSFKLTNFNRKRFWLGKDIIAEQDIQFESILKQLAAGIITEELALEKINSHV